jgi:hypothetical protein
MEFAGYHPGLRAVFAHPIQAFPRVLQDEATSSFPDCHVHVDFGLSLAADSRPLRLTSRDPLDGGPLQCLDAGDRPFARLVNGAYAQPRAWFAPGLLAHHFARFCARHFAQRFARDAEAGGRRFARR